MRHLALERSLYLPADIPIGLVLLPECCR